MSTEITLLAPERFADALVQTLQTHYRETGQRGLNKWDLVTAAETYIDGFYPQGWMLVDVEVGSVLHLLTTTHGLQYAPDTETLSLPLPQVTVPPKPAVDSADVREWLRTPPPDNIAETLDALSAQLNAQQETSDDRPNDSTAL